MDDKSFRVLLDFTEINSTDSELKYVWMFVSPRELKTIFDFRKAIIKKFTFSQENFKLYVHDGLLLDTEKIGILRENDTIKLQFECSNNSHADSFVRITDVSQAIVNFDSGEQQSLSNSITVSSEGKKRKVVETEESPPKKRHKKKRKRDNSVPEIQNENVAVENEEIVEDESTLQKKSKRKSQRNSNIPSIPVNGEETSKISSGESSNPNTCVANINDYSEIILNDVSVNNGNSENLVGQITEDLPESQTKKRKRKRKRKRKDTSQAATSIDNTCEIVPTFPLIEPKSITTPKHLPQGKGKHVIYHSPTPSPKFVEEVNLDSSNGDLPSQPEIQDFSIAEAKFIFGRRNLDSSNGSPVSQPGTPPISQSTELDSCVSRFIQEENNQNFQLVSQEGRLLNRTCDSPKISTPVSKMTLQDQSWGVTPLLKFNNSNPVTNSTSSSKDNLPKLPYSDCTPLTYLPPVGTRLAYKTIELNEHYSPEVTAFKEGIVKNVCPTTDELEIELIQEEIKPARTGKFENIRIDESPPEPQIIKKVSINWTSLIDPRIIT